jgi:hypothetical protein
MCPVLDNKRAKKKELRETKRKRKVDRQREAETVSGIHVPSELRRMCRVLAKAKVFPRWMAREDAVSLDLKVKRVTRKRPPGISVENWQRWVDQQETYFGRGLAWSTHIALWLGPRTARERVFVLILHELCHCAAPMTSKHDDRFATILAEGARELWGIKLATIHEEDYDLDRELREKLKKKLEEEDA